MVHFTTLALRDAAFSVRACALALGAAFGLSLTPAAPAMAQDSVESFYKGRKIDIVIGFSVGGGL